MPKFRTPFFPGQSLLLSTTILIDTTVLDDDMNMNNDMEKYRITGNFRRTYFWKFRKLQEFSKNFLWNGALKFFKPVTKKERITENYKNIFPKYPLKRIFWKFRLTKISGYTVGSFWKSLQIKKTIAYAFNNVLLNWSITEENLRGFLIYIILVFLACVTIGCFVIFPYYEPLLLFMII